MDNREPLPFFTGAYKGFHWMTTEMEASKFIRLSPQILLGKHLAITAFDGGIFELDHNLESNGWISEGTIAYSPRLEKEPDVEKLCCGFDEWYIFEKETRLGKAFRGNVFEQPLKTGIVKVFVPFGSFCIVDPRKESLAELFWKQIDLIKPESYIADGDRFLTFVCRDDELFHSICASMSLQLSTG